MSFLGRLMARDLSARKRFMPRRRRKGAVLGGVAQANQAGILAKGDIEAPMQAVLDAPVSAHGMRDATAVGGSELIT
ncbi:MAG: hypothetical protein IPI21_00920 [Propionivibrio sp.]|nr:hypothetical protein [Propionivibrio sp.]